MPDNNHPTTNSAGPSPAPREAHQRAGGEEPTNRETETCNLPLETEMERYEFVDIGTSGQQLYAKIKKSSKYYGQGERGALFKVFVQVGSADGYVVQGGPGGQYRLADVNLYVVEDGREMRIS